MSTLSLRLRELVRDDARVRELLIAVGLVITAWVVGGRMPYQYPLAFAALAAVAAGYMMLRNQLLSLMLVLFISTIHYVIKVVVFRWHPSAVVVKDGVLIMLFAFWAFELITRQEGLRKTQLTAPLVAFVAWATLQCFNPNTYGVFTILDDYRFWVGPLLIYLLTIHLIRTRRQLELCLKFMMAYAMVLVVYGCLQPLMPLDLLVKLGADPNNYFFFYYGTIRSFATMGAAPFSQFAAMMSPLAFFYMTQARTPLQRWLFALGGMLCVVGVVLSLVRVGWVAVATGLLVYSLATRRYWILGVLLGAGIILSVFATGYTRAKWEGFVNPEQDQSVQIRMQVARHITDAVVFRVFGYGLGTFAQNRLGANEMFIEKTGYGRATDNLMLTLVLEMGWIGLLLFLWLYYKIYRLGFRSWRGLRTSRYRELSIALVASFAALDVAKLGGPAGYYPPESWHYWFLVGVLVLLPQFDDELAEEQSLPQPADGAA